MCDVAMLPSRQGRLSLAQDEVLGTHLPKSLRSRQGPHAPSCNRVERQCCQTPAGTQIPTRMRDVQTRPSRAMLPTLHENVNRDSDARTCNAPVPPGTAQLSPGRSPGYASPQIPPVPAGTARSFLQSRRTPMLPNPCGNANPGSNVRRANAPVPRQRSTKM